MRPYLDLLRRVRDHGVRKDDRTGTGTLSVFGHQLRFDLAEGFPLVTTKKVYFKGLAVEMLWFLSGSTSIRPLVEQGVSIWTDWPLARFIRAHSADVVEHYLEMPPPAPATDAWRAAKGRFEACLLDGRLGPEWAELGPVYGSQWRGFGGVDQIERLLDGLRAKPDSRRHIVTAWNPAEVDRMALPPCHMTFQCYVAEGRLSLQLYVRSNDLFLGAPFNIAQYALLVHLLAQQADLEAGELVYTIGDAHLYVNHLDQVDEQLGREPYPPPQLVIHRKPPSLFDYRYEDFEVLNYRHHPPIKAPVAV